MIQFFVRADGRKSRRYRPAPLGPPWNEETEQWRLKPKDKVNLLEGLFAKKMAQVTAGGELDEQKAREQMSSRFRKGGMELRPPISVEEVELAAADLPTNKAPAPGQIPNEIYQGCPGCHRGIAQLFNAMVTEACAPQAVRHLYEAPLDKPGRNPSLCENERPIALLSPLMELLELILDRRQLPVEEGKISPDQYAYQRYRIAKMPTSNLDLFVSTDRRQDEIPYLAGPGITVSFDSECHEKSVDALVRIRVPFGWQTVQSQTVVLAGVVLQSQTSARRRECHRVAYFRHFCG